MFGGLKSPLIYGKILIKSRMLPKNRVNNPIIKKPSMNGVKCSLILCSNQGTKANKTLVEAINIRDAPATVNNFATSSCGYSAAIKNAKEARLANCIPNL